MEERLEALFPQICPDFLKRVASEIGDGPCDRGLYSLLLEEKPPFKILTFLADFIKKTMPFYKKLKSANIDNSSQISKANNASNN